MVKKEEIMSNEKFYSKILIGKYSPENKCFAEDGAILTIIPKDLTKLKKIRDSVSHFFVDSLDSKIKSRFGWVKTIQPFTLMDFVNRYASQNDGNPIHFDHLKRMLEGIANLDDGTPVAATYFERGVEKKILEFKVHKVFFR